ncbi:hypothetical protein DERP_007634 [Dermatophagoides pteronyssinus]|uniref:Uncharacterized protein n=1 Tax=Dermatophagoides pteronyssinus TaxID=6956 RepID=A0ABQ8JKR7_DERPT|nr:hypothetical protein DERP_007634 [Dermatophagoides pteronyssinus]
MAWKCQLFLQGPINQLNHAINANSNKNRTIRSEFSKSRTVQLPSSIGSAIYQSDQKVVSKYSLLTNQQ